METSTPGITPEGSALGRMFNVMAAPGEVFADLKERPVNHANWIVPAIVWILIGVTGLFVLFSQDWVMHEINALNGKVFESRIASGKMTREQADQAEKVMTQYGGTITKVVGSIMIVMFSFGIPFFWGFFIWIVGTKILKADFEYMKAVEACGLAMIIYVLSGALGVLVSFAMGKLTSISPLFFVKEMDVENRMHMALGALNPLYLWFAATLGSALAALSNVTWVKAVSWMLAVWVVTRVILIALRMGQFVM